MSRNKFINGEAGVGKSRYINEHFNTDEYLLLAPTGVAACGINGKTINSFFCLGKDVKLANVKFICKIMSAEKQDKLHQITTIVIDECYVTPLSTMQKVDEILQNILQNGDPFGGKSIIMLGDARQLPSVDKPAFFGSALYRSLNAIREDIPYEIEKKPRLTPDYRNICNYLRWGRSYNELINFITKFKGAEQPFNTFAVYLKNSDVNAHNDAALKQLPNKYQTLTITKKDKEGNIKNKKYKFKVGMRIMLRRNYDISNKLCNGTIGTLIEFTKKYLTIKVDGVEHTIPNATKFVPAYAITIHKCQGLTLDNIDIYINSEQLAYRDATRLLYVAFTRVRKADDVYIHLIPTINCCT